MAEHFLAEVFHTEGEAACRYGEPHITTPSLDENTQRGSQLSESEAADRMIPGPFNLAAGLM